MGATTPKKCCLATFNAVPGHTDTTWTAITAPDTNKGSNVASSKFYACYKTGGSFVYKGGADAYVTASTFCASGKLGTSVTTAAKTKTTGNTSTDDKKLKGTANTCVCGSSAVFMTGFSLLAILVSLWK